mmetsp:Transcript_6000/g.10781  ORF Transcript_6000/g.10781 Transcript_6000/m.10781 type:complete len:265 (-) Transcript_6000:43-837(-)
MHRRCGLGIFKSSGLPLQLICPSCQIRRRDMSFRSLARTPRIKMILLDVLVACASFWQSIGKMNRVKCYAHGPAPGLEKEALYLLPSQCTLLLVRPDDQKPFWAIPVITEPLRLIHLASGDENAGHTGWQQLSSYSGDPQKTLQLEVSSPRSPSLRVPWSGNALRPMSGYASGPGADLMAHSMPNPSAPASDFMSSSLPAVPSLSNPLGAKAEAPLPLSLSFSDERRRRVAWKVVAQAQHQVCQRLSEGVTAFLRDIKHGDLPM